MTSTVTVGYLAWFTIQAPRIHAAPNDKRRLTGQRKKKTTTYLQDSSDDGNIEENINLEALASPILGLPLSPYLFRLASHPQPSSPPLTSVTITTLTPPSEPSSESLPPLPTNTPIINHRKTRNSYYYTTNRPTFPSPFSLSSCPLLRISGHTTRRLKAQSSNKTQSRRRKENKVK